MPSVKAWDRARDDAALHARDCVLFVVKGRMSQGGAEAGYFRPGPPDLAHEFMRPTVFRAVPPDVLARYENRHRVAIWGVVPKAPMGLLEPLRRHELEHAARRPEHPSRRDRGIERGRYRNPPLRYLMNCAIVLGCSLEDLLDDEYREWFLLDHQHAAEPRDRESFWRARRDRSRMGASRAAALESPRGRAG